MEFYLQITDFEPYLNTTMLISWSPDCILPAELIQLEKISSETPAQLAQTALYVIGGSLPHNNVQPVLTLTFIIALQGVFPARP